MVLIQDEGHMNMNVKSNTQQRKNYQSQNLQKIKCRSHFFNGLTAVGDSIMCMASLI